MSVKRWILAHLLQFDRQLLRARCLCSGKWYLFTAGRYPAPPSATVSVQNALRASFPLFSSPLFSVLCACTIELIWNACLSFTLAWDQGFVSLFLCDLMFLFIISTLLSFIVCIDFPFRTTGKRLHLRTSIKQNELNIFLKTQSSFL